MSCKDFNKGCKCAKCVALIKKTAILHLISGPDQSVALFLDTIVSPKSTTAENIARFVATSGGVVSAVGAASLGAASVGTASAGAASFGLVSSFTGSAAAGGAVAVGGAVVASIALPIVIGAGMIGAVGYLAWMLSSGSKDVGDVNFLDSVFAPEWDYDYSAHKAYKRNLQGYEFDHPAGYVAYGLKVLGKFNDNAWLNGARQWIVAFHGTGIGGVQGIPGAGYQYGPNNRYGGGIYCTPTLAVAECYCRARVTINGVQFIAVFMNRVNPAGFYKASTRGGPDNYWIVPDATNIRPYKLLLKQV